MEDAVIESSWNPEWKAIDVKWIIRGEGGIEQVFGCKMTAQETSKLIGQWLEILEKAEERGE